MSCAPPPERHQLTNQSIKKPIIDSVAWEHVTFIDNKNPCQWYLDRFKDGRLIDVSYTLEPQKGSQLHSSISDQACAHANCAIQVAVSATDHLCVIIREFNGEQAKNECQLLSFINTMATKKQQDECAIRQFGIYFDTLLTKHHVERLPGIPIFSHHVSLSISRLGWVQAALLHICTLAAG